MPRERKNKVVAKYSATRNGSLLMEGTQMFNLTNKQLVRARRGVYLTVQRNNTIYKIRTANNAVIIL